MKNFRTLKTVLIIQVALLPAFVVTGFAQPSGSGRMTPADTRRMINDDNFRELMKEERENRGSPSETSDAGHAALLRQLRDDFKSIQAVNNKMMAEAWAQEGVDYGRASVMIGDINGKATRLRSNLALPEPEKANTTDLQLNISNVKQFKSALLLMDRSLMSFVKNPIFQARNVVAVDLASKASADLESVIRLSASLKKIAGNLKNSSTDH